ncbi:ornithine carbamoyltransferase, partial [Candidatus Sumerlaeota bacterium]|nr:ornithine carbamoyltransferase [Candidatus Sumerlaeota bacterium]
MSPIRKYKRDLRRSSDLSIEDVEVIFELATVLKSALQKGEPTPTLKGKTLAMIFEKPSLRTRATFELGMFQLGGYAVYLSPQEIGLGKRESVRDIARNIERWFDIAIARTFEQKSVDGLAANCSIPLINALSDEEHPCQAMADYFTLREKVGTLAGRKLTYIGDGNNICNSLMLIGAKLGVHVSVSSPKGFEPRPECVEGMREDLKRTGGSYSFFNDPREAVREAEFIYTDVWASMGQEAEAEARKKIFEPYQVNAALVAKAPAGALIMHDLPAHRGEE